MRWKFLELIFYIPYTGNIKDKLKEFPSHCTCARADIKMGDGKTPFLGRVEKGA